jgi:N-acetylneuraminic acid mutarotase
MNFDPATGEELRCDTLALDSVSANLNSKTTLNASGGYPPYQFAFVDPAPSSTALDADTGELTAGDDAGKGTVELTDVGGCTVRSEIAIGGSTLFYVGGTFNQVPSRDVLRSTDGTTWEVTGQLPEARYWGGLVVMDNRLLWIGGNDGNIQRAEIYQSTDGATWTEVGNAPFASNAFGFTIHQGKLVIAGGYNNDDNVFSSDNGIDWTLTGHLPQNNHGGSLVSVGGELIYSGGHDGGLFDWVLASSDGASWTQVGTLAVPREYHTGVRIDGRMWLVGGQNLNPTPINDVTKTTDGINWSPLPTLPTARALGSVVQFGDRVWSFGGSNNAGVYSLGEEASWQVESSNFPPRQAGLVARFTPQN